MDDDTDEGFLLYVDLHSETDLALFSREDVVRLLRLACVPPGSWFIPNRTFLSVHSDVARPLIKRARRHLKRLKTPQLELPFDPCRGAEDYLLSE
jgi:hypothetical protein